MGDLLSPSRALIRLSCRHRQVAEVVADRVSEFLTVEPGAPLLGHDVDRFARIEDEVDTLSLFRPPVAREDKVGLDLELHVEAEELGLIPARTVKVERDRGRHSAPDRRQDRAALSHVSPRLVQAPVMERQKKSPKGNGTVVPVAS